jgi:hypothetical protein
MLVADESAASRPDHQGAYFDGSLELLRELAVTIDVDAALPGLSAIASKMLPHDALAWRAAIVLSPTQFVRNADCPHLITRLHARLRPVSHVEAVRPSGAESQPAALAALPSPEGRRDSDRHHGEEPVMRELRCVGLWLALGPQAVGASQSNEALFQVRDEELAEESSRRKLDVGEPSRMWRTATPASRSRPVSREQVPT